MHIIEARRRAAAKRKKLDNLGKSKSTDTEEEEEEGDMDDGKNASQLFHDLTLFLLERLSLLVLSETHQDLLLLSVHRH